METLKNIRYTPGRLIINEWVFQNIFPFNTNFICFRSSGPIDYVAEWWYINNTYQLKWKAYHETDVNVRNDGTLIKEVDTIQEVFDYCYTHFHPHIFT